MPLFDCCIFVARALDGGLAVAPLAAVTDLRLSTHVPVSGGDAGTLGAAAVAG